MAVITLVGIGSAANDGTGDPLRTAMDKINTNITNLNNDKVETSLVLTAGTGLTGGGDLSTNRTISLSSATIASLDLADNSLQSSQLDFIRSNPQNSQSNDYVIVESDAGKHILHPSSDTTPRTYTIPSNSSVGFSIGTKIKFVNQNGAGDLTISISTDTMRLAGNGSTGNRTLSANGVATALKITNTEWIIYGTNLT